MDDDRLRTEPEDLPHLDDVSARVYAGALKAGRFTEQAMALDLSLPAAEVARCVTVLRQLKLLSPVPGQPSELLVADPETATGAIAADLEERINRERRKSERVQQEIMTLTAWHRDQAHDTDTVTTLSDTTVVNERLRLAAKLCREEVLVMHPGVHNRRTLAESLPRDIEMAERGVHLRVLYQHSARPSLATRSYVVPVTQAGGEVRTTSELVDRMIIFDRHTAFLSAQRGDGTGMVIVRQSDVVAFLCRLFEVVWPHADPFDTKDPGYSEISEELHRKILVMLANGDKDETIARRLGFAARTCRRHISKIIESLGATSRFQAGVQAVALGLIPSKPEASDTSRQAELSR